MCQAIPTETNVVYKLHSSTHTWKTRQYQFCFGLSLYAINQRKLYIVGVNIRTSMNRRKAAKQPYEGYTLPAVSEKGGQFVDFKRIVERKPVRVVKRRKNGSDRE